MFNKRKKAEQQKRLETRLMEEKRIEAAIAEAAEIQDPAEKLLKLEELKDDISGVIRTSNSEISLRATTSNVKISAGAGMPVSMGLLFGSIAVVPFAPPVGFGMMAASLPSAIGISRLGDKRGEAVTKKLQKEAEGHFEAMDALAQTVEKMRDSLIDGHKEEIIHSPFFDQVLETPGLSGIFIKAAAQRLSQYKEEAEAAKKADAPADAPKPVRREPTPHIFNKGPILK